MKTFHDRTDAGEQLTEVLRHRGIERPVVLGIPRGGVVVSVVVAAGLSAQHGVVVARKLGAPTQPELAIGAETARGIAFVDHGLAEMSGANEQYLEAELAHQIGEAKRREAEFDGQHNPSVAGQTVIIVDDGVATGATAIAAIRSMKAQGAERVIFATPVGPTSTIAALRREADEVVCLRVESDFYAVGQFYDDFQPIEDREVKSLLEASQS